MGDTAVVFAAQVLSKLRGLITLPLLVRGLGTEAYGTWTQTIAFTILVTALVGLNLHLSLIRFIAAEREKAGAAYATTLLASLASASVLCALLGLVAPPELGVLLVGTADPGVLHYALAIVVTTTVRNLNLNLYRATERLRLRSLVDLVGSMLELGAISVVFLTGRGLLEALEAMTVIGALIAAATTLHGQAIAGLRAPDWQLLRGALRYGVPLVPASLALWVLDRSDRFVISLFWDQSSVGVYSAHYAIGSLMLFVQGPIQMALVPKVMQLWDKDRETASEYVAYSFRIFATIAVFFVVVVPLLAPTLFRALANEEVARGCELNVALISIGTSFSGLAIIETCGLYAARRTAAIGLATAGCAALNLLLCLALVPLVGIVGAGVATLGAYVCLWFVWFRTSRGLWTVRHSVPEIARAALAVLPVGALAWLASPTTMPGLLAIGCVCALVYLGLLFVTGAITAGERAALAAALRGRLGRRRL